MIKDRTREILRNLPEGVDLLAATKERSISEIKEAISGGIKLIGENYVQEARTKIGFIGPEVKWHLIGHLQKNKVKQAVKVFDCIETLDSYSLAETIDEECQKINKVMPVLIEINSAGESQKCGVFPDEAESFLRSILGFKNLQLKGLMTMGPWEEDPERLRPYFKNVKKLFDKIKTNYEGILEWKYLSMGMSSSYKVAAEEGANIIRVGTAIFGPRRSKQVF